MRLFLQRLTMFVFVITVMLAMATMALSWRTGKLKSAQVKIENEIEDVRTGIRVLEAEWSRLNQPALLQAQAEKFLSLQKNLGVAQISNIQELPSKQQVAELIEQHRAKKEAEQMADAPLVAQNDTAQQTPKSSQLLLSQNTQTSVANISQKQAESTDPIGDILGIKE